MGIFTKTGDQGETSLFGGKRVKKSSRIINAIGNVDELCACTALLSNELDKTGMTELSAKVQRITDELFTVGADLANPKKHEDQPESYVTSFDVETLENDMIEWEKVLPALTHFVLPYGNQAALMAYYTRAMCRRAERSVIKAWENQGLNPQILKYLNRLGDWLFMCFRLVNHKKRIKEQLWNAK